MNDYYLLIPLVLWLSTYGITSAFRHVIEKKVSKSSTAYVNFQLPNFLSNLLNSLVSVGIMLFIMNQPVSAETAAYFAVPYFGILSYYITCSFRALKDA